MISHQHISLEELYDRFSHLVYRRCFVLLGNQADAEDALQEVYVKALHALDSFKGESSPMTWLYRIATNHCLNVIRSNKRRNIRHQRQAAFGDFPKSVSAEKMEVAAIVRQVLPRFNEKTQRMAICYFVDGMGQEEIATQEGLSVPTVRKRLKSFIAKANKVLEGLDKK